MTAVPIASNQFWCENCTRYFSSPYNLSRHQKQSINACRPDANKITPRKIVDALTGQLRYRTADEQRELARMRKVERYWDVMSVYLLFFVFDGVSFFWSRLMICSRSAERVRKIRGERPQARSRRKEKETPSDTKDRRTNDTKTVSVDAKRRHWAAVLREAKKRWGEDRVQEQAQLLAAFHNVGSMRVPGWVKKDIYTYMDRYALW